MNLAAIKTTSEARMEVDDRNRGQRHGEGEEPLPQTPSFAVSPSFALLLSSDAAGQTPRANTFDAPATAESLPSDVLWRLATLLPVEELPAMMAVCKSWRFGFGAAIDALAPGSLSDDAGAGPPSASFLPRRFPCLRSLDLSSVPASAATDQALVEPLQALTGLTRLSLRGCRCVTAPALARVLSALPRLRSLDLSGCVGLLGSSSSSSKNGGGFAAAMPEGSLAGISEFSADRVPWLGDGDVEALARALLRPLTSSSSSPSFPSSSPRGLVKLSLDGAGKLVGGGIAALSLSSGGLERLSLAGCAALDDSGLALGSAPFASSLAELVLDRCPLVTGRGLALSGCCFPALRRLSSRDSGFDDAGASAAVSSSSGECRFPALEELILDDCSALTDYGVEALAGSRGERSGVEAAESEEAVGVGLPALARLSLARLPRLEGWGLSSVLGSSPGLASLCLAGCVRLSDAAALAIGESGSGGSSLKDLDVSDCERVGVGFCSNLSRAPLVRLRASRCPRLSPAAVEALGSGRAAGTLEELEVSGCAALVAAAGGDESENAARGGGGASALAAALPNLRSLDLSATPLSRRGLEELLLLSTPSEQGPPVRSTLRLPRLATLNLACCPRLSRPAVQRLLQQLGGGGSGSGLRVNSWGCKEEDDEGGEEKKKARPSIIVGKDPSSSSPALSFGHLSPQRGNRAAAAALAAAA